MRRRAELWAGLVTAIAMLMVADPVAASGDPSDDVRDAHEKATHRRSTPRPVVTKLVTRSGPVSGGVRVTIKGKHLAHAKRVRFGKAKGTGLKVKSARRLSVVAPHHKPGWVKVVVTVGKKSSKRTKHTRFKYVWVQPALAGSGGPVPPTNLGHSLALRRDGTVFGWGENYNGQLSVSSSKVRYGDTRRALGGFRGARAIAAGEGTTYAVMWDRTVKAVGSNLDYALGTDDYRYDLAGSGRVNRVRGVTKATAVAAGSTHALALRKDGTVVQWGANYVRLDGTSADKLAKAVRVRGVKNVKAIAASDYASFALRKDGTVWAWGSNGGGELGTGDIASPSRSGHAIRVGHLSHIVAISAGGKHALALQSNGDVWSWGQVEPGTVSQINATATPTKVAGISHAVALSAGVEFSAVALADHRVISWGTQYHGQLGDGVDKGTEFYVGQRAAIGVDSAGALMLQGGASHQLVMRRDGRVLAWGFNNHSQLGLGKGLRGQDQPVARLVPKIDLT
jgi:alpha-tubulin suppressor-like RCC1 family protein